MNELDEYSSPAKYQLLEYCHRIIIDRREPQQRICGFQCEKDSDGENQVEAKLISNERCVIVSDSKPSE